MDSSSAATQGSPSGAPRRYRTFAGTIVEGMDVIAANGDWLGRVDRVEGDHIVLLPNQGDDARDYFVSLSMIDGIDKTRILLADRGDGSFGLGAEP